MAKPAITDLVGGYLLVWAEDDLSIKVSKLHCHTSDGRVTGELLISTAQTQQPLYPQTSFNFCADRTRSSIVKALSELDSVRQWGDIINQLCLIVVDRARQGEPVRQLWTSEDVPPPEWLLKPILYRELPTIIYGEKAVCKSTLALAAYACLMMAWDDNPLGWEAPVKPVVTLLADYEVDYKVAQSNAKKLQGGMELDHFPLLYRRCSIPLADDVEQLQRHIAEIQAEVIIVDSLGPAVGGDLKDPAQALRFTTALRQLKCAALIIGQTSKGTAETKGKSSVFGSTFFEYYARNIFELKKVQEDDEDSFDVALYNTYHNLGKRAKPQGFHVSFNGYGTRIESAPITADELIARIGMAAQITNVLKRQRPQRSMTPKELAEETNLDSNKVRVTLGRMVKGKRIVRMADDKYGLPDEK